MAESRAQSKRSRAAGGARGKQAAPSRASGAGSKKKTQTGGSARTRASASSGKASRASARSTTAKSRSGDDSTPKPSAPRSARRSELSAIEAAQQAREHLSALLGRPIESVLGVDRDHGSWVVTAQVLELSRIPNTTDVLGEYEATLDRRGEIVRYRRTHRYHRAHVDEGS
jgi:hypothetical protein